MSNKKYNQKHLTITERIWVEKGLNDGEAFASIARRIEKHPTTIAKEVKRNRYFPPQKDRKSPLPCERRKECQIRFLCDNKDCVNLCKTCYSPGRDAQYCSEICPDYLIKQCSSI